MIRLCFGTFIDILVSCKKENITKKYLVKTIIKIIDSSDTYIGSKDNVDSALNHIYKCTGDFLPQDDKISKLTPEELIKHVTQQFADKVVPLIDKDKRTLAILAICDIISKDSTLSYENNGENIEKFESYIGKDINRLLNSHEYIFSEFLAGVFLYTVEIKNTVGKKWIEKIRKENNNDYNIFFKNFVNDFMDKKNTIRVFDAVEQLKDYIHNDIGCARIGVPKNCQICLCCKNWEGDTKAAYQNCNGVHGLCKLFNERVISSNTKCDKFVPNYAQARKYDMNKKFGISTIYNIFNHDSNFYF